MSKAEEKKMRQRLDADRSRTQSQYGEFNKVRAPERAGAVERKGERYAELAPQFRELATTGGMDPTQAASIRKGYQDFAGESGGLDPSATSRLRGFYGSTLDTGGYGAKDVANIRGRSNAAIPAVYARLKESARRAGGSNNPATAALMAKLGRQEAQGIATTTRDTETDIADRIRSGKFAGAQGMQGVEESVREGKGYGLQGQQTLESMIRSGRLAGMGGLQDLFNADREDISNLDQGQLAALRQGDQATAATYQPDLQLATRPGVFSNIMQGIGAATSLVSPFMGGLGALSKLKGTGAGGGIHDSSGNYLGE